MSETPQTTSEAPPTSQPDNSAIMETKGQGEIVEGVFLEKLLAKTKPMKLSGNITVEDFKPASKTFRLCITYSKNKKVTARGIMADAKAIGTAAVLLLVDMGIKPKWLTVWAHQDAGRGVTGEPLIRSFGRSSYDSMSDHFEWITREN